MDRQQLRKNAAELARDCRTIPRSGSWTIREWNHAIRMTVKNHMDNVERFHRVHGTWED